MTLLTDIMVGLEGAWGAVKPYKEAIFGLVTITGGAAAAFFGGYRRQAKKPEAALAEAASYASQPISVTRLHADDRQAFVDLTESLQRMTRAARDLCGAMQDQSDACHRAGRRRGDEA